MVLTSCKAKKGKRKHMHNGNMPQNSCTNPGAPIATTLPTLEPSPTMNARRVF